MNGPRFDPYKNFRYRMKWEARHVAAFSKLSPLSADPGRHEAVTLERGVTFDAEFDSWANSAGGVPAGTPSQAFPTDVRRELVIEVYDEAGQVAIVYRLHGCWVSEYQAQPDLDAHANAMAIQHLRLENEGWEQDTRS